jgi:hypothetical protein
MVREQDRPWRRHAWRVLALWAIALAAYSNSFQGGMVFDNSQAILHDSRVHAATAQNIHLILNQEYWYNSATTGLYRPLTTFSYLVNYAVFGNGPNAAGYHWVNLALHLANILLVYLLGLLMLDQPALACALAALWGIHPMLTESVTNIVGRADLLAALGVLGGLLCHVAGASAKGWHRAAWLAGVALSAAIGIFSKESAAVLPGVLLLYDLTWAKAADWRRRAASYVAVAAPFLVYFSWRSELHSRLALGLVPFLDNPEIGADFWTARLTAVKVIGKYLGLWFWPSRLSADYSYNSIPLFGWRLTSWEDAKALIALAVCVACAVLAVRWYRRRKPLFFLILFFFVTLAPVSNLWILIGTDMAERFVYLPSIAIAAAVVLAVRAAWRTFGSRRSHAWMVAMGAICLAFAVRTYVRNLDWRTSLSLWTSTAASSPESFKAHWHLAATLMDAGAPELDHAVAETDRTLTILDGLPDEYCTAQPFAAAGLCYRLKGDSMPAGAASQWRGKALAALLHGERVDAVQMERVHRLNLAAGKGNVSKIPWPPLYLELGRTYLRLDRPAKALAVLTYGRSHSSDPEFIREQARAWQALGDWQKAAIVLIEGMVTDSSSSRLALDLAELYQQTAPDSCAVRKAAGQAAINMDCPLVHDHVCRASRNVVLWYRQGGQAAKAAATAGTAVRQLGCPAEMFQ